MVFRFRNIKTYYSVSVPRIVVIIITYNRKRILARLSYRTSANEELSFSDTQEYFLLFGLAVGRSLSGSSTLGKPSRRGRGKVIDTVVDELKDDSLATTTSITLVTEKTQLPVEL